MMWQGVPEGEPVNMKGAAPGRLTPAGFSFGSVFQTSPTPDQAVGSLLPDEVRRAALTSLPEAHLRTVSGEDSHLR